MELLVKETLELKKGDVLFPHYVGYTFFKESDYQGKVTHKEAILAYLNYTSRIIRTNLWSSKKRKEAGKSVTHEMYAEKFHSSDFDSIFSAWCFIDYIIEKKTSHKRKEKSI